MPASLALPATQRVMVMPAAGQPLAAERRPVPQPGPGQVLVRVLACAVCRTDLHVQDGELPGIRYPVVPGHQAVGDVVMAGAGAVLAPGTRVGVAWLAWACGQCGYCLGGRENLCDAALFHGCHLDGGYAEYLLADARFCFPLDPALDPVAATPLLCAGLIGYRTLRLAGNGQRIGLYGFGSAAHLVTQVALHQGRSVHAFTRPGDTAAQDFARQLGACWAGGSDEPAPAPLDAALLFAPAGELVPKALRDVAKGGCVVCGGIHMSDIPSFPYADLWGERQIRSVANLTREDGREFLALAAEIGLRPQISTYPLERAGEALMDLREGRVQGSAVLVV